MNEDFDDFEENFEEEDGGLILSFENGEAKITDKKDYENTLERQQELIREFMNENIKLFQDFLNKKGISEDEFNGVNK